MAMRPRSSIVRRRILNADLLVADLAGTCQGGPDGTGCSLRNQQQVIDSQSGYGDLMIYLLPPVQGRRCKLSRQYCRLVAGGGPWQRVKTLTRVSCRPSDPTSWSRCSVTSSRCALCCTAPGRGADPHLRLDTEKRITRVMRPRLAQRSRRRPRRGAPTADQVHCTFTLRSAAPPGASDLHLRTCINAEAKTTTLPAQLLGLDSLPLAESVRQQQRRRTESQYLTTAQSWGRSW